MKKHLAKKPNSSKDLTTPEVVREINKKTSQENKEVLLQLSKSEFHHGPLPTPEYLFRYEQICPGAADRIIKMAEKEQKSVGKMRLKEFRSLRLGLIFGFISLICLMALTGIALFLDKPWVAGVLIAVVSACTVLVSRKKVTKDNNN